MPFDSTHKQFQTFERRWSRTRDALAGEEMVRAKAGESAQYVEQAPWYAVASRTLDGLTGAVHRRPPVVRVPRGHSKGHATPQGFTRRNQLPPGMRHCRALSASGTADTGLKL